MPIAHLLALTREHITATGNPARPLFLGEGGETGTGHGGGNPSHIGKVDSSEEGTEESRGPCDRYFGGLQENEVLTDAKRVVDKRDKLSCETQRCRDKIDVVLDCEEPFGLVASIHSGAI